MRAYRLCRARYPAYDGEGACRAGGRWNSTGTRVVYMSENRSLAVLEVLVHLTDTLPDKYALGSAEIPDNIARDAVEESTLPFGWGTLIPREQYVTRKIGDEWMRSRRSAVLSVPSVVSGERNLVLNPGHADFRRIDLFDPISFVFDARLLRSLSANR
jgi:RES domain-containing protein